MHTLSPTSPLSQQVGGHAGIHVTEDESLLLKPALPREIAFYQLVRDITDQATGLHLLKPWIPNFFGLLSLHDQSTQTDDPPQTLVLQNLLYGYLKPCVLDVKLGTVLYDEDASEDKKARMIKKAAETTSLDTGLRLTGFQVYSQHTPDPVVYGKAYGYGLKPEQLQEGIERFFPASPNTPDLATSSRSNGLPADILLTLLTGLHTSLTNLRESIAGAHVRIVGGSVLMIYEADWERAAAASGRGGGPGSLEEADVEEELEADVDEQGELIMDDDDDDEIAHSSSSEASCADTEHRSYTVSLIDFAHARIVPGEGPDQGILTGMDTLIGLVDRRKRDVAASMQ